MANAHAPASRSDRPTAKDVTPELVHVVAPPHTRESDIKKAAFLLGALGKFEHFFSMKTFEACYAATYAVWSSSAILALDFVLKGIRFFPHAPDAPAKAKLLTLDKLIPLREERELDANISAGTLLWSVESLKKL